MEIKHVYISKHQLKQLLNNASEKISRNILVENKVIRVTIERSD